MSLAGRPPPRAGGIGSLACYQCIDQVGEGTYGYVYKAKDKRTNEIVALKRLIFTKELSGFPLCAVREIKFLKGLRHKNIVLLKDVVTSKGYEHLELPVRSRTNPGEAKQSENNGNESKGEDDGKDVLRLTGNLYFVFEFIEHDLGGLIDAKYKFPPRAIKCIMRQLFEVLDFLNDKKIVHRDIKSSNILITTRYQVKLADFGLARSLQSGDGRDLKVDMTNKVITLWYRPPELLLGAVRYSSAVDMWSAGCVLAELELSRPLFPGKTEADQMELICKTIGTVTEDIFPGVSKLPHYEAMLKNLPKYGNNMKALYQGRLSALAEGLLERILVPDPLRRSSAKIALTNKYFHTQPLPPADPLELEPMNIAEGTSFHEYKTKLIKRQSQEELKRLAEAGASSTATDSTTQAQAGPSAPLAPALHLPPPPLPPTLLPHALHIPPVPSVVSGAMPAGIPLQHPASMIVHPATLPSAPPGLGSGSGSGSGNSNPLTVPVFSHWPPPPPMPLPRHGTHYPLPPPPLPPQLPTSSTPVHPLIPVLAQPSHGVAGYPAPFVSPLSLPLPPPPLLPQLPPQDWNSGHKPGQGVMHNESQSDEDHSRGDSKARRGREMLHRSSTGEGMSMPPPPRPITSSSSSSSAVVYESHGSSHISPGGVSRGDDSYGRASRSVGSEASKYSRYESSGEAVHYGATSDRSGGHGSHSRSYSRDGGGNSSSTNKGTSSSGGGSGRKRHYDQK